MESPDRVYAHNDHFVFRRIEDEAVLVPIRSNVGDLDSLFSLNAVGAFIWRQIDGVRSLALINDLIVSEFDVSAEEAEAEALEFISELCEIGAVQPAG